MTASPGTKVSRDATGDVAIIDSLRGLAALAVMWFHFTQGNAAFLPAGWLKSTGTYGYLGVDAFFVISGFVVPYSLVSGGYDASLRNYLRFVAKRVCRIDPPYLASVAVVIALGVASSHAPGFKGAPASYSWTQIALHAGYLTEILGRTWINPVYWSLAIEFQFYLLLGGLFWWLTSERAARRYVALLVVCIAPLLSDSPRFVPHYAFLFLAGFAVLAHRTGRQPFEVGSLAVIATFGIAGTLGAAAACAGAATMCTVLWFPARRLPVFDRLGHISYSLYLLHVPVGGRVINIGVRFHGPLVVQCAFLLLASFASLTSAFLLWRYVETPCRRFASSVRFVRPDTTLTGPGAATDAPKIAARTSYAS